VGGHGGGVYLTISKKLSSKSSSGHFIKNEGNYWKPNQCLH